jgi:hypothetical protein
MSQIGVSFTPNAGSPVYSFTFSQFSGADLPRTYQSTAAFNQSANGTSIITGAPYRQKYIWAVSAPMTTADAASFDAMFRAWDTDRSAGLPAAVGVIDQTFGATVNTSAVISTPPTYIRMSPTHMMVAFGLTEV